MVKAEFSGRNLRSSGPLLQVKVISQQEVGFEREKGALIVDIRPSGEFEAGEESRGL